MKLSIAHLRAAGLSDSQILKALEEAEAERREKDRIRQRNHRARHSDRCDMRDTVTKKVRKKEPKKTSSSLVVLPENWRPSDLVPNQIPMFEHFADHARANDRRCAGERGWEAAWRNWKRLSPKYDRPRNGSYQSLKDRNREVMDELNEFIERTEDDERRGRAGSAQGHLLLPFGQSDGAQGISRGASTHLVEVSRRDSNRGPGEGDAGESELPTARAAGRTALR
jgi:hypothetical protein